MTDKLTLADCYKYPKARIFKSESFSYSNIYDFIYHSWESQYSKFVISDCKLILRDISQLTDAEKIYINDNLFYELFKNTVSLNANAVWNSLDELLAVCGDKTALIDYLRSISVDIDGMIASGKAVKDGK